MRKIWQRYRFYFLYFHSFFRAWFLFWWRRRIRHLWETCASGGTEREGKREVECACVKADEWRGRKGRDPEACCSDPVIIGCVLRSITARGRDLSSLPPPWSSSCFFFVFFSCPTSSVPHTLVFCVKTTKSREVTKKARTELEEARKETEEKQRLWSLVAMTAAARGSVLGNFSFEGDSLPEFSEFDTPSEVLAYKNER